MIFIVCAKYKKKPTKETLEQTSKLFELMIKEDGVKFLSQYWTLGRYDVVSTAEAKDEKAIMKTLLRWGDLLSSETLIALPREEAIKLVE